MSKSNDTPKEQIMIRWFFMFLFYGITMGVVFSLMNGSWLSGMGVGLLSGVIFSTMMCIWMNWFIRKRIKEAKSNQPDFGDEDILFEGGANHFKGVESVGGYLWLTSRRLFFRSHGKNIQDHELEINLSDIEDVSEVNKMGLFQNEMKIRLSSGQEDRFVVNDRMEWISRLIQTN